MPAGRRAFRMPLNNFGFLEWRCNEGGGAGSVGSDDEGIFSGMSRAAVLIRVSGRGSGRRLAALDNVWQVIGGVVA
jgi:hypothetical protein